MEKFGRKVVQLRIPILILSLVLLIPSFLGYVSTRVNYDILSYLPKDIETMVGQDILVDEFGTGAFSMFVVEGMEPKEIAGLKADIEQVEHVEKVIWYDSVMDISVPMEMVPDELYEAFNSGEATMMAIIFNETTSADGTMEAIENIRKVADRNCFLSGMSAVVTDTKNLSEREAPIYVGIAVLLSCLVLSVTMDSFLIPFLFLASIGMAIVYNLGSNFFMGEISYITKALSAVLQLGVTMDYSIFLWHSYQEKNAQMPDKKEAMAGAIADTVTSVVSSSMTTVAGFIALCFMSFTLGMDLGIVMAKGVVIGVIACITVLPSMILVFDKALKKTKHKALLPDMNGIGAFVTRHYGIFIALFVALLFPALFGYKNTKVYYNLDETLPKDLPSIVANDKLNESFDMNATHMLLLSADLADKDVQHMTEDMKKVDGVNWVLGLSVVKGAAIPAEFIPSDLTDSLENENWQLLLIGSQYKVASEEVNRQCERLSEICKSYDDKGMLVGEAPCTKDLIEITDKDFGTVSVVSIGVIFIIIMLVFKSISLPAILVSVIEMAIFINMGIPYYTGTEIPFIASVVIGTIQLGATVDYAILMTTRYRRERFEGMEKKEAVAIACQSSVKSILVSALSFFAATFGVGLYSNIDMISSLCTLMARGALISMVSVIFTLPSMFMVFDRLIMKSGLKNKKKKKSFHRTGGSFIMNKNRRLINTKRRQMTKNLQQVRNIRSAKAMCLTLSMAMALTACGGAEAESASAITEGNQEQVLQEVLSAQVDPSHSREAGKVETVYVLADAKGAVNQVIVSDWLKNSRGGESLADCSDLTDIENVKGYETFEKDEKGNITWQADGADIYYRGSTDKEVPVEVKLSYQLDGKDISPEELAGKSGRVTIRIDYENKETQKVEIGGKEQEIKVPFAMLSGMVLPQDTFSNIEVTNARLLSEGNNSVVVGIAFPGLKESINIEELKDKIEDEEEREKLEDKEIPDYIEITADARDFELGMTMTVAMSDILSDINLTDSFDLSELNDSMDELQEASNELKDGTVELKDGTGELKDGTGELLDGTMELWDGTVELKDGTQELAEKSVLLDDGAGQLNEGAAQLDDGAGKLSDGAAQLDDGVGQLNTGAQALLEGSSALVDGTTELQNGALELTSGAGALQDGSARLTEGTGNLINGAKQLDAGAGALVDGLLTAKSGAEQIQAGVNNAKTASEQLKNSSAQLYELAKAVMGGSSQTVSEMQAVIGEELANASGNLAQAQSAADQAWAAYYSAEEGLVSACTPAQYSVEVVTQSDTQTLSQEVAIDVEVPVTTRTISSYQTLEEGESEDAEPQVVTNESTEESTNYETQTVYETVETEIPVYSTEMREVQSIDTDEVQSALASYQAAGDQLAACEAEVAACEEQIAVLETLSAMLASGDAVNAQANTLVEGLGQLSGGISQLDDGLAQLSAGAQQLVGEKGLTALSIGANQLKSGTASAVTGAQELDSGANALKQGIVTLNEGAGRLADGTGSLKAGAEQLKNGTSELKSGAQELKSGSSQLRSGASELKNGTSDLRSGAGELKDGTVQLVDGTNTLNDGAGTLKDGVNTLKDGVLTLDEGAGTLDEGVLTLMNGMFEFDEEGIRKLTGLFGDDVQDVVDRLKAVAEAGEAYNTFTRLPEDMDGSVKFIIKTEAIKEK